MNQHDHYATIDLDAVWLTPGWDCRAPHNAPCHAEWDCDCEQIDGYEVIDGRPTHLWRDLEGHSHRHVGTFSRKCVCEAWLDDVWDSAEMAKVTVPVDVKWCDESPAFLVERITRADVSAALLGLIWNPADPFSYANAVTDVVCRLFGISEEGQP